MAKKKPKQQLARQRQELKEKHLDRRHVLKHLPQTPQSERLIQKEGAAHVFLDEATMLAVAEAIMDRGEPTGVVRGHERWGLWFDEVIGCRVDNEGNRLDLHYGELKVTGDHYHVIPRTKPAK